MPFAIIIIILFLMMAKTTRKSYTYFKRRCEEIGEISINFAFCTNDVENLKVM